MAHRGGDHLGNTFVAQRTFAVAGVEKFLDLVRMQPVEFLTFEFRKRAVLLFRVLNDRIAVAPPTFEHVCRKRVGEAERDRVNSTLACPMREVGAAAYVKSLVEGGALHGLRTRA